MDIFDRQKRSEIMSRIRGKNTKPELRVRSCLHTAGLRYVLHDKRLPGRPDIVFPSRRIAIFVHGCFWHGHEGCKKAKLPETRSDFWQAKIESNRERDTRNREMLEALGWQVRTVWQCSISDDSLFQLVDETVSTPRHG
ncbi:very short patch repair endonuclease [Glycocaulis sp.]|uniref:very short patch repair endonuclease n=1 Tax=Glycocaulis sp. TaxID=1969725 RepID=UPI003D1C5E29